ncbi:MAG TPA: acyl-CoA dehydrogenase family protein [Acidimicrobiia bacterium]|nr:acyl-CoA dehydrogenase family protein [Acidimicrobiia bacterium]
MDFELSDDQLALRDGARELLDGLADPTRVRTVVDAGGGVDHGLWKAMVEQGWTAVDVPEERGGLGLGAVEVAVLVEEIGRHVAPAPFLSTLLALGALTRAGREEWAARLAGGDAIGCVAWTRTGHGGVRAERDRLTGRSDPVPFAPSADVAVVTADTGEGPALFLVELGEGEQPRREPAMDLTRELAWLRFDETPAERVGGSEDVEALLDCGAAFTSAEMLGGAARAMEMAVDYAKDRVQFGRPIGSFQAVKHRCADMLVDVEGMRSSAYWAAWCIGAGHEDASVAASTAKIWCSDASKRVMASALQVHGGIGFTWEHDLHLFLKRAQLDQVSFGDAAYHRQRLADLLRPRVETGRSVI